MRANISWCRSDRERNRFARRRFRGQTKESCSPKQRPNPFSKYESWSCLYNRGDRKHFRRTSAHGLPNAPPRAMRGQRHNCVAGAMRISETSGGSTQVWKRTRCTSVHRPIMTAAQTGPTSRNNALRPNKSNRPLPTRSPRPASGKLTARPAMFRIRTQRASFRHRPRTHCHRSQPR